MICWLWHAIAAFDLFYHLTTVHSRVRNLTVCEQLHQQYTVRPAEKMRLVKTGFARESPALIKN